MQPLVYGRGEAMIHSREYINAYSAAGTDSVATISDGYLMSFRMKLKNTSNVTADLIPEIALNFNDWTNKQDLFTMGAISIYSGNATIEGIRKGEDQPISVASDTTIILPTISGVNPGVTTDFQEYKIYFERIDGLNRSANNSNFEITAAAKAVLPGQDNWYSRDDDEETFSIMTHVFSLPEIVSATIKSNNWQLKENHAEVEYISASGGVDYLDNGSPHYYQFTRNIDGVVSTAKVFSTVEEGGKVNYKGTFKDYNRNANGEEEGIPWLKPLTYDVVQSFDDYGELIGESTKTMEDICGGGLVEVPDDILRPFLKWAIWKEERPKDPSDEEKSTNIMTVNNMILPSTVNYLTYKPGIGTNAYYDDKVIPSEEKINDLEGLQYLKRTGWYHSLFMYLDNNAITTIMGKLPTTFAMVDLSLSQNPIKDIDVELGELKIYETSMQRLYLSGLNITSLENLPVFSKIKELGLSKNAFTDVSKLNELKSLEHINIAENEALENIAGQLGENGQGGFHLPNLNYLSILDCTNLTVASKNYVAQTIGGETTIDKFTYLNISSFPEIKDANDKHTGCRVMTSWGNNYVGKTPTTSENQIETNAGDSD